MLKLSKFTYGTTLDLKMGYYHIELDPFSKQLCTLVLPWGKYEYQRLPMGLCNSPDIFQKRVSTLFQEIDYAKAYIDDVLCLTSADWNDHLEKLEPVLEKLQQTGLKVHAGKFTFGASQVEYL